MKLLYLSSNFYTLHYFIYMITFNLSLLSHIFSRPAKFDFRSGRPRLARVNEPRHLNERETVNSIVVPQESTN